MSHADKVKGEKAGEDIRGVRAIPLPAELVEILGFGGSSKKAADRVKCPKKGEPVTQLDANAIRVVESMEAIGSAVVSLRIAVANFTAAAVAEPCPTLVATGKPCKIVGCCAFRGVGGISHLLEGVARKGVEMLEEFDKVMEAHSLTLYAERIKTGVVPGPVELGMDGAE